MHSLSRGLVMSKKVVVKKKKYLPPDIMFGPIDQYEIDFDLVDEVKCECGSEKTYGKNTVHSSWCPKHKA